MNRRKRLTALLLALAMCLSVLPANVLAVELGSEGEAAEVVESKDSGEPVEGEPSKRKKPRRLNPPKLRNPRWTNLPKLRNLR